MFWIPLFQILEARGLEVCLVNAHHVKHVPGRKTDIAACQWLQYLHACGLLTASFRPAQGSRAALGGYYRRMRAKLGGPKAITATAHKLARVVYHLIRTGQPYDESIFRKYEETHRDRVQQRLQAKAAALGLRLVPATVVP